MYHITHMEAEDKSKVKVYTPKDFADEYDKLCKKMGLRIVANPVWVARDDGSFSLIIRYSVEKIYGGGTVEKSGV